MITTKRPQLLPLIQRILLENPTRLHPVWRGGFGDKSSLFPQESNGRQSRFLSNRAIHRVCP